MSEDFIPVVVGVNSSDPSESGTYSSDLSILPDDPVEYILMPEELEQNETVEDSYSEIDTMDRSENEDSDKPFEALCFSDAKTIAANYKLAVDAMVEEGVLNGFEDNTFRPTDTLTREQGAKIVAYLLLGAKDADALTCTDSPYSDVETDRWSAPYIRWCTEWNVLHGMGDGSFRPDEKLTGAQFAKMLLCAYGFGRPDRYTGEDWLKHVVEDGDLFGLFVGDARMKDNTPLQRQQAALLALNVRLP